LVPCGRLSWLLVSFWAHVNTIHRIVFYRPVDYICRHKPDTTSPHPSTTLHSL